MNYKQIVSSNIEAYTQQITEILKMVGKYNTERKLLCKLVSHLQQGILKNLVKVSGRNW